MYKNNSKWNLYKATVGPLTSKQHRHAFLRPFLFLFLFFIKYNLGPFLYLRSSPFPSWVISNVWQFFTLHSRCCCQCRNFRKVNCGSKCFAASELTVFTGLEWGWGEEPEWMSVRDTGGQRSRSLSDCSLPHPQRRAHLSYYRGLSQGTSNHQRKVLQIYEVSPDLYILQSWGYIKHKTRLYWLYLVSWTTCGH